MSGRTDVAVLVMAKAPRPGAVKTRLARDLGAVGAAKVAAAALLDTLSVTRRVFGTRVLALAGDLDDIWPVDCAELRRELGLWLVIGQSDGDLGHRLAKAHVAAAARTRLADGHARRVLQVGMDTPHVTDALLEECARQLHSPGADAILGPADDGGWWVCGTSDPAQAAALADVPMSRTDTGERTLAALREAGALVNLVPALRDLDTLDDAKVIAVEHPDLHVSVELKSQGVG